MEVQSATRDHCRHVEEVARRSFQTSYSLSPRDIDTVVHHYFTEPQAIDRVESSGGFLLVAVDEDDDVPWTEAPFRGVYRSDSDESQWGYLCTECGSTNVSADGFDRLECKMCGNTHLAEQWDGAYLWVRPKRHGMLANADRRLLGHGAPR